MPLKKNNYSFAFILLLFLLGGSTRPLLGQPDDIHIGQTVYDVELKAGFNEFIYYDSFGYIWVSSMNGIFRTNGQNLSSYLPNFNIQSNFFEDSSKAVWVASYKQLHKYDRVYDRFQSFQITNIAGDTILDNYKIIHLGADDIMWLKAGNHIYKYDLKNDKALDEIETKAMRFCTSVDENGQLTQIVGCNYFVPGLQVVDIKNDCTSLLSCNERYKFINCVTKNDSLVFLFSDNGIMIYNSANEKYTAALPGIKANDYVKDGVFLNCSKLYLVNDYKLQAILDIYDHKVAYSCKQKQPVYSAFKDRNSLLWLMNYKNTLTANWVGGNKFNYTLPDSLQSLNSRLVFFMEDSHSRKWFVTKTHGIFLYDENSILIEQFPYDEKVKRSRRLYEDSGGNIWAFGNRCIYVFEEEKMAWKEIYYNKNYTFFSMLELDENTKLISTSDGLFKFYHGKAVKLEAFKVPGIIDQDEVMHLYEGRDKYIYIPVESEVWIYNKENQIFRNHKLPDNAIIFVVVEDVAQNKIWLGTSNGLKVYHLDSEMLESVNQDDSPEGEIQVMALAQDAAGDIWFISHNNLFKYTVGEKKLIRFWLGHDVPAKKIKLGSGSLCGNNNICFFNKDGILEFNPSEINPYPVIPGIELSDLSIKNYRKHIPDYMVFGASDNSNEMLTLNLDYNQNSFDFTLKTVGFYLPEYNKIYFKLNGVMDSFIISESKLSRSYNNLSPGEYVLEAFVENAAGLTHRDESGKQIITEVCRFYIARPFWKEYWFLLLCFCCTVSVLYWFYRVRLAQQSRKQELVFAAKNEERNRIAGELHDDIGSGLSSIRLLSDSSISLNPDLDRIHKLTYELQEKMANIIWAMNDEYDTLESLIGGLYEYADEYLELNNLKMEIQVPRNWPPREISGSNRRNILLVFKEILHNTVKHANAKLVRVEFVINNEELVIFVRDDGIGFDPELKTSRNNGLKNIRSRIENIGGHVLIDGTDGTAYRITIPLKTEHENCIFLIRWFKAIVEYFKKKF